MFCCHLTVSHQPGSLGVVLAIDRFQAVLLFSGLDSVDPFFELLVSSSIVDTNRRSDPSQHLAEFDGLGRSEQCAIVGCGEPFDGSQRIADDFSLTRRSHFPMRVYSSSPALVSEISSEVGSAASSTAETASSSGIVSSAVSAVVSASGSTP